ncbi:MAG TPA: YARHG domain-containing protein [Sporosarcina psychrophila]|uniref:YARHG domain-containing protein n=1 Tax=Sporosarcina psychrophila TaxID=1476 RepID=A0A921G3P7_SPOPS|nr:YARHG domain-containing protein [Sporosarcina psychrophila]
MNKCIECGENHAIDTSFCLNCGSSLTITGAPKRKPNRGKKKKIGIIASVSILLLLAVAGYQGLKQKHGEEAVIDRFLTALSQKDERTLKELIIPSDPRIKITHDSLIALFDLLDQNPSAFQEIKQSISNDSLTNTLFTMYKKGKVYGLVTRYVIDPSGYTIVASATGDKTIIFLNDQELGYIEKAGDTNEYGPFLPGVYQLRTITMVGNEKVEDEVKLILSGAQTKKTLEFVKAEDSKQLLQLAAAQKKKDEEKKQTDEMNKEQQASQKVVIKEVIQEVPVGGMYNYYIIPSSDYYTLSESDLNGLSKSNLRIARNEIYARHGFVFDSADLQNYFNNQAWYYPNSSYKGILSAVEKHNVDLIKSFE